MKNKILLFAFLILPIVAISQTKQNKLGITIGGGMHHYNGNLGNSFFALKSTFFGAITSNISQYVNSSFDANVGASIGHFGYCQTDADKTRIVSQELRCPACPNTLGMGELRSLIVSGNIGFQYKFTNGYLLKENAKFAPYLYLGIGINHLSDNMQRNCVNVGTHATINTGAGIKYNITNKINIGYNLGVGYFISKKVYYTNPSLFTITEMDEEDKAIEKRKDLILQNSIFVGINF
jgi:Outer membrane protein beta-barrel domain